MSRIATPVGADRALSTDGNSRHPRSHAAQADAEQGGWRCLSDGPVRIAATERLHRIPKRQIRCKLHRAGADRGSQRSRGVDPGGPHPPRALRRQRMNRGGAVRALTEGQYKQPAESLVHLGSLDTDRCSDMLKRPEKPESARDFGISTRWWMRPRRRRPGMQRTHVADPSGIRTACGLLFSGSHQAAPDALCLRDRRHLGESALRISATTGTAESFRGVRELDLEQLLQLGNPRSEARSSDGTSLADLITQMVPRLGMGPLNREGARR